MRPRKILVLVGGTVAFVGVARSRRFRARRVVVRGGVAPSPPRLRIVPLLARLTFGWYTPSINFGDLFFGLGNFVVGLFGWVLDLVEAAIRLLGEAIMSIVSSGFDALGHITDAIIYSAGIVADTVHGLEQGAFEVGKTLTTLVPDAFRSALREVQSLISKAVDDWLPWVFGKLEGLVEPIVRKVLGDVWDAIQWLGGAWHLLRDGWDIIYQLLTDPIGTVWGWIIQPLLAMASDIVAAGLDLLYPGIRALFDWLFSAGKWLVDFAIDPIGTIDKLVSALGAALLPFIQSGIEQAVNDRAPALEKYLTDALGLN